jgi:electron transport complex protein RnfB
MNESRRAFLRLGGRILGASALGALVWRFFSPGRADAEFVQPDRRYAWRINPDKCRFCGACAAACVRRPAAVKALNDQKKCSNCVVCYGHILQTHIASAKIDTDGKRVCPYDAVRRRNLAGGLDGAFVYTIDQARCAGCGRCALRCNELGTKSMFLVIRPDLCLDCNHCASAAACPYGAMERFHLGSVSDLRPQSGGV